MQPLGVIGHVSEDESQPDCLDVTLEKKTILRNIFLTILAVLLIAHYNMAMRLCPV